MIPNYLIHLPNCFVWFSFKKNLSWLHQKKREFLSVTSKQKFLFSMTEKRIDSYLALILILNSCPCLPVQTYQYSYDNFLLLRLLYHKFLSKPDLKIFVIWYCVKIYFNEVLKVYGLIFCDSKINLYAVASSRIVSLTRSRISSWSRWHLSVCWQILTHRTR